MFRIRLAQAAAVVALAASTVVLIPATAIAAGPASQSATTAAGPDNLTWG